MPHIETPAELADFLANQLGIYGAHIPRCGDIESLDDCNCRVCFVTSMTYRIRAAVANENLLSPAPQAQEETRGAPAPVGRDPLRKAVLYILERHYLSVAERGGYTTNQAVEDVVAAFRENPQAPGLDAKNLLDTAKFWIEKGDQEGASQWRFGLVKLAAKARDSLPGNPKIRPQPPAPASPGGRECWVMFLHGEIAACSATKQDHWVRMVEAPAAPEAGAPGTQGATCG